MKKIVFVAGDKSGDFYAGLLTKELKTLYQNKLEVYSFGGPALAKNSRQIINLTEYAVSGIFEVARNLGKILSVFTKTIEGIKAIDPDLIILVDFPDFNLRIAKKLNNQFKIFYYISPQVWAWRKKRVNLIKKYTDKIIVIFKFEEEFYKKKQTDVLYFGHPLLDSINSEQSQPQKLILLLPGSRENEIRNHLPVMLKAKKIMEKEIKNYRFLIVRPENIEEEFYKQIGGENLNIIPHSYDIISKAEFIITSSGTATLEIAIMEIPFLLIYKVHSLTWLILRMMVKIKFIGMPNIIAKRKIVEEYIQNKATPQNIAGYCLKIIKNKDEYSKLKEGLKGIKEKLTPYGAIENTVKFIGSYLGIENDSG